MNILPKKRWHVRTRENIARVRRDEAAAAEIEKSQKARSQKAETEARINLLRQKTRAKCQEQGGLQPDDEVQVEKGKLEHVNFFADLESGMIDHHKPNAEHESEKKAEREKYEQQIGYLTYLGQNINSSKDNTSWYNELPQRLCDKEPKKEIQEDKKLISDPIADIRRYMGVLGSCRSRSKTDMRAADTSKKRKHETNDDVPKKKRKDKKKTKRNEISTIQHSKSSKIEKLRDERLAREKAEKMRTDALLAKLRGESVPTEEKVEPPKARQKYNSQFFPEIARQNAATSPRH